ncbi:contractile injection system tape measure protein [Pedobacter sp. Hv1]|uniref:contractile injection system tape measure protein n=1 Tax=Pedobacter sp. Hv1 TaxID=1740090 RepID=UPI0006D8C863|nr:contractile injection system tape measure protein [Pedobacter sp. Hv1]KQC01776.1 hypothetical protein AQF98_05255 [Pedobacter sp. Hv1]
MRENLNHIIAKLSWDTSFDMKEKAIELQERLSTWSKIKMPQNVVDIFDQFCPIAQTWKIKTLAIDLGQINFDHLEFELTTQLRAQLNRQLIELIINGNRGSLKIEIEDHPTSHLQLLRYFLLNGLLPWSYKSTDGSINQILAEQLKNNLKSVAVLLREIGQTDFEVRKRIAWQANEANLKMIVIGLEPHHHIQVIDFSNELIKIQTKENVVRANGVDFKKHLWLWILDYLLTERGTIFNKVAFMKSNIEQMAAHYNVSYDELLMLIESAADQISLQHAIQHEFITIIHTLSTAHQIAKGKHKSEKSKEIDYWERLKRYFLKYPSNQAKDQQIEFNELMVNLARADQSKFERLVLAHANRKNWWKNLAQILNEESLEVIYKALNLTSANDLIQNVYFLTSLNKELQLNVQRNVVWEIGLQFLEFHQKSTFTNALFLAFYIDQLSKKSGLKKEQLASRLLAAHVPSSVKTLVNIAHYSNFTKAMGEGVVTKGISLPTAHITTLIAKFIGALNNNSATKESILLLQNQLSKSILQNPKLALAALIAYTKKDGLEKMLPYLLSHHITQVLLKEVGNAHTVIFSQLKQLTERFKKGKGDADFSHWLHVNISYFGLMGIITQPQLKAEKLVELILIKMAKQLSASQINQFKRFVYLVANTQYGALVNVAQLFQKDQKEFTWQQVYSLMVQAGDNRTAVGELLLNALTRRQLTIINLQNKVAGKKISNYLMRGGAQLMELLLAKYNAILVKQLGESKIADIEKLSAELYWKCLLAYQNHMGNQEMLKRSFKAAILYHFNLSLPQIEGEEISISPLQQTKLIQLQNGQEIAYRDLFLAIETCLKLGSNHITKDGVELNFNALIAIALETDAKQVKKILASFSISKKRIILLHSAISFDQLTLWMIDVNDTTATQSIQTLKAWFNLVEHLLGGAMPELIEYRFWNLLWKTLKTNRLSTTDLNQLVQTSLFEMTRLHSFHVASIIAAIKDSQLNITPMLANILEVHLPNFSKLNQNIRPVLQAEKIAKSKDKGLLYELSYQLICKKQIPSWYNSTQEEEVQELLHEIMVNHPVQFFLVLKQEVISEAQLWWLSQNIDFKVLIKAVTNLNKAQNTTLKGIEAFYFSLGNFMAQGISAKEIQYLLFKKALKTWLNGNWKILSAQHIWQELTWDICLERGVDKTKLIQSFDRIKLQFPPALQITFAQLADQQLQTKQTVQNLTVKKQVLKPTFIDSTELLKDSIYIQNAGLVLINHYIPMLFERLGIISDDKKFLTDQQQSAVHYLQFVATGLTQTEEPALALNKILCGIPLNEPITNEIEINEEEVSLIEGLITTMIGYWGAIGSSSIDGFRGNWLIRDGLLIEYEDKWELTIEKRAYDLLIHQSPFTFSIIKYPWMNKPLYVQWPH